MSTVFEGLEKGKGFSYFSKQNLPLICFLKILRRTIASRCLSDRMANTKEALPAKAKESSFSRKVNKLDLPTKYFLRDALRCKLDAAVRTLIAETTRARAYHNGQSCR